MKEKKCFLLHPFLFAVYFVFYFWSKNLSAGFSEVCGPTLFFLLFSIVVVFILGLIIRSFKKAGITTTLFFILFFSYGHARTLLGSTKLLSIEIGRHSYLMVIWFVILILFSSAIIFLLRREKTINVFTTYLNLTGLLLVVSVLFPIISFQLKHSFLKQANSSILGRVEFSFANGIKRPTLPENKKLPDIYYIILDSYMNQDVLKSELGFDNSEFCDWLRDKGFFVSSSSISNYVWTGLSLPSSLNFRYFTIKDKNKESDLLYNNEVVKILSERGYSIISVGGFKIKADARYQYGEVRDFLPSLLSSTWIYPLTFFGFLNSSIYGYQRENILYDFEILKRIPEIKEPTFTFAHIICPHPPYIFNEDGGSPIFKPLELFYLLKNKENGELWHSQECRIYTKQALFVAKQIKIAIEHILSLSPESIIIIQGDHGQFLGLADRPSKKLFRLRTSILNAYYFPGGKGKLLYNGISPVNSFRVIFDEYFNENYKLLPDVSYFSSENNLWDFITINKEDLNN
jgi:hypothetical protein